MKDPREAGMEGLGTAARPTSQHMKPPGLQQQPHQEDARFHKMPAKPPLSATNSEGFLLAAELFLQTKAVMLQANKVSERMAQVHQVGQAAQAGLLPEHLFYSLKQATQELVTATRIVCQDVESVSAAACGELGLASSVQGLRRARGLSRPAGTDVAGAPGQSLGQGPRRGSLPAHGQGSASLQHSSPSEQQLLAGLMALAIQGDLLPTVTDILSAVLSSRVQELGGLQQLLGQAAQSQLQQLLQRPEPVARAMALLEGWEGQGNSSISSCLAQLSHLLAAGEQECREGLHQEPGRPAGAREAGATHAVHQPEGLARPCVGAQQQLEQQHHHLYPMTGPSGYKGASAGAMEGVHTCIMAQQQGGQQQQQQQVASHPTTIMQVEHLGVAGELPTASPLTSPLPTVDTQLLASEGGHGHDDGEFQAWAQAMQAMEQRGQGQEQEQQQQQHEQQQPLLGPSAWQSAIEGLDASFFCFCAFVAEGRLAHDAAVVEDTGEKLVCGYSSEALIQAGRAALATGGSSGSTVLACRDWGPSYSQGFNHTGSGSGPGSGATRSTEHRGCPHTAAGAAHCVLCCDTPDCSVGDQPSGGQAGMQLGLQPGALAHAGHGNLMQHHQVKVEEVHAAVGPMLGVNLGAALGVPEAL